MTIGVHLDFPGATVEQYDQARGWLGLLRGGPAARGQLFHWATGIDDGIRLIEVWESRKTFDSFLKTRVLPVLPEVGVDDPPEIESFPVHNYFVGRRSRGDTHTLTTKDRHHRPGTPRVVGALHRYLAKAAGPWNLHESWTSAVAFDGASFPVSLGLRSDA